MICIINNNGQMDIGHILKPKVCAEGLMPYAL